jgi:hypothetical protein
MEDNGRGGDRKRVTEENGNIVSGRNSIPEKGKEVGR